MGKQTKRYVRFHISYWKKEKKNVKK